MSNRPRKTRDVYYILLNYGQGWEHECTEDTWQAAKAMLRTYRENVPYPVKAVRRRERITNVA